MRKGLFDRTRNNYHLVASQVRVIPAINDCYCLISLSLTSDIEGMNRDTYQYFPLDTFFYADLD